MRTTGALALAAALVWQTAWAASVTLNLKDADIGALIGTVAEVTGTNFIVDPRVKGKVTVVSSKPMESDEVYQVFLSILMVHGFAAVPSGSVVKIVPDVNAKSEGVPTVTDKEPGRGDEVVTRVIEINNVSAAQLVPILRPLVPQQGHLAAYPGTNVLIVSDRAENIERLVSIVRRMDQQSDSEIELMPLAHASAAEVVRIITALNRPQPGQAPDPSGAPSVIADERTNSVLIGGGKSERLRLRMIISHLDTPLERGGNTHVVYLKYAKATDLVQVLTGVSSSIAEEQKGQGAAATQAQGTLSIQADENANALVINAPPDVYRSLASVIRQLDIRRAQVHVEAVIAELASTKAVELGIQWRGTDDISGSGVIGGTNFQGTGTSINAVARNPLAAGDGLSLGYFEGTSTILGTEFLNIGALIRALGSDSSTNILATPNLVTLDNQEAEIVVAQNVPFVTGSFTNTGATEGATNPFQTIQRQDVGLTLKVKPQINEGDAIKLEIEQEISDVSTKPVSGASDIVTNKRSIKTNVLVEDGQMVVLGGLLDDNLVENIQKVPLLGDLPLLGNLFKSRSTDKTKRNLMVFIQPSILRDAAYYSQTSQGKYNYIRSRQVELRESGVNLLPNEEAPVLPEYPLPRVPAGPDAKPQLDAAEPSPSP
ncbi:MAG: type II secretion system secretin GspD [Thauera sp.]|nr:type II secretion system secretin GspD [Thauera sp.]